jgi:5-methylcytosine-specific restriction endonuclease McrA
MNSNSEMIDNIIASGLKAKQENKIINSPKKQRIVNKNLGKNITKDHNKIYDEIEKRLGETKQCFFGHKRGSKTGVKHEGCVDVPIRNFELRGAYINEDKVIIEIGDGLQGFCRKCSQQRRKVRIDKEKSEKNDKTPEEIYELYKEKYNTNLKKCSRCNNFKILFEFNLSIGMECGLHNMCKLCSYEYGSSVGDRWIIYMPDGNYKYNKHSHDEHDDHIFPLSLGGSNEEINHQLISSIENLKKSNDINYFISVDKINPELLSLRYRNSLIETNDLNDLKIRLNQYVYDDIVYRCSLNDVELYNLYNIYCKKNNLRRDINRAVRKFREYCKLKFNK